jgi:predicted O-methyltransferase YrrM
MAQGLPEDGQIVTLEIDKKHAEVWMVPFL